MAFKQVACWSLLVILTLSVRSQNLYKVKIHDDIYASKYILPARIFDPVSIPFSDELFYDWSDSSQIEIYEQFNDSVLNFSDWYTYIYAQNGLINYNGAPPGEIDYLSTENVIVKNGVLQIIAKELGEYKVPNPTISDSLLVDGLPNLRYYRYSSGQIATLKKYLYCTVEARIKIPDVIYLWPAFTMFGGEQKNVAELNFGGRNCEIDMFEFKKTEGEKMLSSLHYWLVDEFGSHDHYDGNSYTATNFQFENSWHTYKLEWNQFVLTISIDGVNMPGSHFHYYALPKGKRPSVSIDGNQNITGQDWGFPVLNGVELREYVTKGFDVYVNRLFPTCPMPVVLGMLIQQTNDPPLMYSDSTKYLIVNDKAIFPSMLELDWIKISSHKNLKVLYSRDELKLLESEHFNVYPNPTHGNVSLTNIEKLVGALYSVYDLLGNVIREGVIEKGDIVLEISDLKQGTYLVKIQHTSGDVIRRISKF
jgi:hypothetical protein